MLSAGAQYFCSVQWVTRLFRLKSPAAKPIIQSIRSQPGARPSRPTIEQK